MKRISTFDKMYRESFRAAKAYDTEETPALTNLKHLYAEHFGMFCCSNVWLLAMVPL